LGWGWGCGDSRTGNSAGIVVVVELMVQIKSMVVITSDQCQCVYRFELFRLMLVRRGIERWWRWEERFRQCDQD